LLFKDREAFRYDLLVGIPPHRAPDLVKNAGLTNQNGWIPVNPQTLATAHEGVFALGDVTSIPIPGRWKADVPLMLPKAGVFAHLEAEAVAERIVSEIRGRQPLATFGGDGYCMLESGHHMAGFAFGNFYAEPSPKIELRQTGKTWHLGKVLFEKWWLAPMGCRRDMIGWALKAGGDFYGIHAAI
jgi:sulfide:quinone oxidoreductase